MFIIAVKPHYDAIFAKVDESRNINPTQYLVFVTQGQQH